MLYFFSPSSVTVTFSTSMNPYFSVTDTRSRRRPRLSQKLLLEPKFTNFLLEFPQPRALRYGQRWLVRSMRLSGIVHPVTESLLIHLQLPRDRRDRTSRLDHQFRRFFL